MPDLSHRVYRPPSGDGGRGLRTAADAARPGGDTITPGRLTGFDRLRDRILDRLRRLLTGGGDPRPAASSEGELLSTIHGKPAPSVFIQINT